MIYGLISDFGHFGYAAYFIILELLHRDGRGDVLTISPQQLCFNLRSKPKVVRNYLVSIRERSDNKIITNWDDSENIVVIEVKNFRKWQHNSKSKSVSKEYEKRIEGEGEGEGEGEKKQITDRTARVTFQAPRLEDVRSYCLERSNRVDPQRWLDHYTSNGWKVGKNSMKDWKAAVRTWEKNDGFNQNGSSSNSIRTQPTEGKYAGLEREA